MPILNMLDLLTRYTRSLRSHCCPPYELQGQHRRHLLDYLYNLDDCSIDKHLQLANRIGTQP